MNYECPVNDDFRPSTQLDYLESLHYQHRQRIEAEATEIYQEELEATGNSDYAKFCYFRHIHLYTK